MRELLKMLLMSSDSAEVHEGGATRLVLATDTEDDRYFFLYENDKFYGITSNIELVMDFMIDGEIKEGERE